MNTVQVLKAKKQEKKNRVQVVLIRKYVQVEKLKKKTLVNILNSYV